MAEEQNQPVDADTVRTLAALADLNLADEQVADVRETLNAWIPPANELNEKMARAEHWTVTPITVFAHKEDEEDTG